MANGGGAALPQEQVGFRLKIKLLITIQLVSLDKSIGSFFSMY
jgi:hypothetical protein